MRGAGAVQRAYHRQIDRIFRDLRHDPGAIGSIQAIVAITPDPHARRASNGRKAAQWKSLTSPCTL
jgi:hypothetical protein